MEIPRSIESQARQTPSRVRRYADRPTVVCGCCRRKREQHATHEQLGPLCLWCAQAFDYTVDQQGRTVQLVICPACQYDGACDEHA